MSDINETTPGGDDELGGGGSGGFGGFTFENRTGMQSGDGASSSGTQASGQVVVTDKNGKEQPPVMIQQVAPGAPAQHHDVPPFEGPGVVNAEVFVGQGQNFSIPQTPTQGLTELRLVLEETMPGSYNLRVE